MRRLYVYALVDEQRRSMRIAGRRIDFVAVEGIHAAVERRAAPPKLSEAGLRLQHRIVVQLAGRFESMLPVRFGTWMEEEELTRTVTVHSRRLRRALDEVRNREQVTVRMFGPGEPAAEGPRSSSGTAYMQARRGAGRTAVPAILDEIRRAVQPMAVAESVDAGAGRVFTSVHHLIERGRSREYTALVKRSCSLLAPNQDVVVSGPFPPFAFTPEIWP